MPRIREDSGAETDLSLVEAAGRYERRFGLSPARAAQLAAALEAALAEREAVTLGQLDDMAARLVVAVSFEEEGAPAVPMGRGDLAWTELVPADLRPFVAELERAFGGTHDVEFQGPAGIKWEEGEGESRAPRLVSSSASQPLDCCKANVESIAPGRTVRGVKVTLDLGFTDRDSGDDSTGLKRVHVRAVTRTATGLGAASFFSAPGDEWTPSDEERERSRTGSVSHRFVLCVPCAAVEGGVARFAATAEDAAGNTSIQIVGVSVPDDIRRRCCEPPAPPAPTPTTPTPGPGTTPDTDNGIRHYRVNLKLVLYIPYEPNEPPMFNRVLPVWNGQMNGVEDSAMRGMLSTGNPEPPPAFPTPQSFTAFVESKEYRGILDWDLQICCAPDGTLVSVQTRGPVAYPGYTPSMSGAPVAGLHRFHLEHESLASQIQRLIQSGVPNAANSALWLAGLLGANPLSPDAAAGLRALDAAARGMPYSNAAEPFTKGHLLPPMELVRDRNNCLIRLGARIGAQVNAIENILFFLLTSRLLPFMWGELEVSLCCGGGLRVNVRGSSIPNKWLYVNNRKVDGYDLLRQPFTTIRQSVPFGPGGNDRAFLGNPAGIQPTYAAEAPLPQFVYTTTLPGKSTCPTLLPAEWVFE